MIRFLCATFILSFTAGCNSKSATSAPQDANSEETIADIWFEDVTAASGVDFTHVRNSEIHYYFPEIMGAGVAVLDYDNDGLLDIYCVQSGPLIDPSSPKMKNQLFRNLGDWTFANVTEKAGCGDTGYGMGVACGDYDRDGDTDFYVTNVGENQLYQNNGDGTFTNVTLTAGVGDDRWSTSAAWVDYDRDGDLDLFVANYVNWSLATEVECKSPLGNRDYCQPTVYRAPARDTLYRNNGDGTFSDVTEEAGLTRAFGNGLGVTCGDFNQDGWVDICVANDQVANQLWMSQRDGTFVDEALLAGAALNGAGQAEAGMGVFTLDVENDGDLDLFMTHYNNESNTLYRNDAGQFADVTAMLGLAAPSLHFTSFGTGAADFDCDGFLDIYVVNGRVGYFHPLRSDADPYAERNQLLIGTAAGRFEEADSGDGTAQPRVENSRGLALGDFDRDGGIDLIVANSGGSVRLLRNVAKSRGNWVGVEVQDQNGSFVVGAVVKLMTNGREIYRTVNPNSGYCSSSSPTVHFGLGAIGTIEAIAVTWPDGGKTEHEPPTINQWVTLHRDGD